MGAATTRGNTFPILNSSKSTISTFTLLGGIPQKVVTDLQGWTLRPISLTPPGSFTPPENLNNFSNFSRDMRCWRRIAEIEEGTLASNEILGRRNYNVINPQLMKSRSASRSLGNVSRDDSIVDYLLLSKYKLENLEETERFVRRTSRSSR